MANRPQCPTCKVLITKKTVPIFFSPPGTGGALDIRAAPKSQEEAQKHIKTGTVVSAGWNKLPESAGYKAAGGSYISRVGVWDGKSYNTAHEFFCSDRCAGEYARAVIIARRAAKEGT